ncbi:MAG: chloride channel protein [Gemmatimonadota bacterium]
MKRDPHIPAALQREFADWNLWLTRVVVIGAAACAGLSVVGFTRLTEVAIRLFSELHALWWWAPLIWTPLLTALIVWATGRYAPGAAGSGIPQVMATLDPAVDASNRGLFVSLRLSLAKVGLTTGGLLAGLSLGREGPSVQVAAGVMLAARRWLPARSTVHDHGLLVAGGAAGIAAAFNTPLAGVMFAIEELSRSPEQRSSGLLIAGIVLAGIVAVSLNGNATYFGVIRVPEFEAALLLPGLLTAVASGVAGGLFARLLKVSLEGRLPDRFTRWRRARPVVFAAACGLGIAVIGIATGGAAFGSGYDATRAMLEGQQSTPMIYFLLKFVATWLTTWTGVPAGIFAPALSIGGALGNDIAALTNYPHAAALIALGMTGFLAATTQAPLTAFIIVMEMVDGHSMVLTLMAAALIASGISRILCVPLYGALARLQLGRLGPAAPVASAAADGARGAAPGR